MNQPPNQNPIKQQASLPLNQPASTNNGASYDVSNTSIADYIGTMFDYKWLILILTVLSTLGGSLYVSLATPIYETNVLLQVQTQQSSLGMDSLTAVSGLFEDQVSTFDESEILRSRMVLGEVVKKLKLEIHAEPKYFPIVGRGIARQFDGATGVAKVWFGQAEYAWGGEHISIETLEVPPYLVGSNLTLVAGPSGSYQVFDTAGRLLLDGRVGVRTEANIGDRNSLRLFVSRLKARPGTHFVIRRQALSAAINRLSNHFSVAAKSRSSGILGLVYSGTDKAQLATVLNAIADIYVRQNVEYSSAEAEKSLRFLDKQLPPLKERLDAAANAYNAYRIEHGSVDLAHETNSVLSGLVGVDSELSELQQKRDELRGRFKAIHPTILALDKNVELLQKKKAKLEKDAGKLPNTQQDILRLLRDVEVNTTLYTKLLNTSQELKVAKAGMVGNVRIIDYAFTPNSAIKPKKSLIVAIAFMSGLLGGILLSLVLRSFNGGVEDPDELEKALGFGVYASVIHSDLQAKLAKKQKRNKGNRRILAEIAPEDLAIESLRSLRTALHFSLMDSSNNKIIMVTGASPGIGKTFITCNLGSVLTDNNKSVIVVDADMRRGQLHKYFGLTRENGLSELITEKRALKDVIQTSENQRLSIITSGKLPPSPSELLLHESFTEIFEKLSTMFDYVIVDVPPVLAVTDAAIVGRHADTTLFVVKANHHPMRELEQSVKSLRLAGVNIKGAVFNDVDMHSGRYGYGKYVYHYGYQNNN